jgi:hypothetical protein
LANLRRAGLRALLRVEPDIFDDSIKPTDAKKQTRDQHPYQPPLTRQKANGHSQNRPALQAGFPENQDGKNAAQESDQGQENPIPLLGLGQGSLTNLRCSPRDASHRNRPWTVVAASAHVSAAK